MSKWTPEMKAAGARVRARMHQLIADNPGISSHAIAELFDMPIRTVAGHLTILSRDGRVVVKRGAPATGRRPRQETRAYPTDSPVPRAVNKGGAEHTTPMPDDPEHRAWMEFWKNHRAMRQAGVMVMRERM